MPGYGWSQTRYMFYPGILGDEIIISHTPLSQPISDERRRSKDRRRFFVGWFSELKSQLLLTSLGIPFSCFIS